MSREVVSLRLGEHLDLASDIMTLGRIRHMPVMSGTRLVGVLSQRDLFRAAVSSALDFRPEAQRGWLSKIRVEDAMTGDVITARPDWTIRQAVDVMVEKQIGCLPVVEEGRLIGLLSETDCLRLLGRILAQANGSAPRPSPSAS